MMKTKLVQERKHLNRKFILVADYYNNYYNVILIINYEIDLLFSKTKE